MTVFIAIAAFLSIAPLILLLSAKTIPEYAPRLAALARFFPHQALSLATVLGLCAGVLAAFLTVLAKAAIFPDMNLYFKPSEAISATATLAFLNAGLVEEVLKCLIALALCWIAARGARGEGRLFLASAPFLCGGVGAGFALIENFQYFSEFKNELASMVLVRGLVSAPIHVAINFNFGLSLFAMRRQEFPAAFPGALLVAVLLHGLFDFFAIPPVPFANFLAILFQVILVSIVLHRLYAILPESRYRAGRFVEAGATSPEAAFPEISVAGALFLERELVRDPYRLRPVERRAAPFAEETFPLPSEDLREALLAHEFEAEAPEAEREYRAFFETAARAAFAGSPAYVWDSAIFARQLEGEATRGAALYADLRALGIDLVRLAPLRVLEFWPAGSPGGAYRYLSLGLGPLLGRECLLACTHPFALARLPLLAAAAGAFGELGLFRPTPCDPVLLGDPRGWFCGLLPMPLLDPVRASLEKHLAGRTELPWQLLYLSRADLQFIHRYGVQNFFIYLKQANFAWSNDFYRSGPTLDY